MKRLTSILWLIGFFSISALQAQNFNAKASTSFTVWTVHGQVNYTEKGMSELSPVMPGMTLKESATVNVAEKSSVKLVRNKDIVSVNEKGNYSLNGDIINKITNKQSEATAYFFQQLIVSTKFHDGKKGLTEQGSGYGTGDGKAKSQEQGSGYGTGDGKAKSQEQGSGYGTGDGKAKSQEQGAGYGTGDGKAKSQEQGAGYGTGDGKAKSQEQGAGYGTGDGKAKSQEQGAGYGSKDNKATKKKMKKAIAPLKADSLYKKSKKVQKLLMKATVMEKAGLHSMSVKFYKKALSKNANDPIAKQMYAAFLERNN